MIQFLAVRAALPEYLRGFVTIAYKEGWRLDEIETLNLGSGRSETRNHPPGSRRDEK
jgi:hypothetical protein